VSNPAIEDKLGRLKTKLFVATPIQARLPGQAVPNARISSGSQKFLPSSRTIAPSVSVSSKAGRLRRDHVTMKEKDKIAANQQLSTEQKVSSTFKPAPNVQKIQNDFFKDFDGQVKLMPLYKIGAMTYAADFDFDDPMIGPMLASGLFVSYMMDKMINKDQPIADHIIDEKLAMDIMLKPEVNIGEFSEQNQWMKL